MADFWGRPFDFSGWSYRSDPPRIINVEVPHGFYRCEGSLSVFCSASITANRDDAYSPGDFVMKGMVFTPYDTDAHGIEYGHYKASGRADIYLRAFKGADPADGKLMWGKQSWPSLYLDDEVYRSWASSTAYHLGERFKHVVSSETWIFEVTQAGTTSTSAPANVTGAEVTDGTVKWKAIGTSRLSNGKNMNDCLIDTKDVGILVYRCWAGNRHRYGATGYAVSVGAIPKKAGGSDAVAFSEHHCDRLGGCKFGLVLAAYKGHRLLGIGERLNLVDFPIGGVVWETTDYTAGGGTMYEFDGPAGGESSSGNWSISSDWAPSDALGWVNDSFWHMNAVEPHVDGASKIPANTSCYGVVVTHFGQPYPINNNQVFNVDFEWSSGTAWPTLGEATNYLFYTGYGCKGHTRCEDTDAMASAIFVERRYIGPSPRQNLITTSNSGKQISSNDYWLDQGNGYNNLIVEGPYQEPIVCETLYGSNPRLRGTDMSWYFNWAFCPMLMVEFPADRHKSLGFIRIRPILSEEPGLTTSERTWGFVCWPFDQAGNCIDFSNHPRLPIVSGYYSQGDTQLNYNYTYRQCWISPTLGKSIYRDIGVDRYVNKVGVGIYGDHLLGFRIQVIGAQGARIYNPRHEGRMMDTQLRMVDAVPERGLIEAPCLLRYRDGTGTNQLAELNKAAGQLYYCVSGAATGDPSPHLKWGYSGSQGSADIKEWDGDSWETIATGAYYVEPSDFGSFIL